LYTKPGRADKDVPTLPRWAVLPSSPRSNEKKAAAGTWPAAACTERLALGAAITASA